MTCPHTGKARTRRSVLIDGTRWRVRECLTCGQGFITTETAYMVKPNKCDNTLPLFGSKKVGSDDSRGVES